MYLKPMKNVSKCSTMQYCVISLQAYLGVLSTHTHANNIKPLCQPRIQVKIPLKPGSTTLSRTHWHTDNICMQIPQSLGPTTLSPPILVTSNPQKYPNMERWSVHLFFRSLRIEPCWAHSFCVVKMLKTILQQPSHAFLISFSRFFFNSTFITATLSEFCSTFFNMITYISFWLYIYIYIWYIKSSTRWSPETWPTAPWPSIMAVCVPSSPLSQRAWPLHRRRSEHPGDPAADTRRLSHW